MMYFILFPTKNDNINILPHDNKLYILINLSYLYNNIIDNNTLSETLSIPLIIIIIVIYGNNNNNQ